MREYKLVLNVPDDFDPEQMEVNLEYPGEIEIVDERFVENPREAVEDKVKLVLKDVGPDKVALFTFPQELVEEDPELLAVYKDVIEQTTGLPTIGYVNDIELLTENADDAVNMLNGMITKIKLHSSVKEASRIILPE